jgi:NitT/TauT family transport system permease protein
VVPKFQPTVHALFSDVFVTHVGVRAAETTLKEAALGLLVAGALGLIIGSLMGLVRIVELVLYPLVITIQSVPKIALAPLMLLIFGFGIGSKVATAAIVAFLPILVNVMHSMKLQRLDEVDMLRSLGASRWQLFYKLRVLRALPVIFAGFQVGVVFALLGAVVGEFLSGSAGLGYLVNLRTNQLQVPGLFSAIIILAAIGIILNLMLRLAGRVFANWQES